MSNLKKQVNNIFLNLLTSKYSSKQIKKILSKFLKQNKKNKVKVDGKLIEQIYDDYNVTFMNERTIEIPFSKVIIHKFMKNYKNPKILEIGNTLIHYETKSEMIEREIVDKYEVYPNVINKDIMDFTPKNKFDIIFSISTLEHVGSDYEEEYVENKFKKAIDKCLELLDEKGVFIVTLPIFYRDVVDNIVFKENFFTTKYFFQRRNFKNDWFLSSEKKVLDNKEKLRYNSNFPLSNALFVGVVDKNLKKKK